MRIRIDRKIFPARAEAPARLVFENLSLDLSDGEICALVGPSGVGKTSLLQIAAGLDHDFEGSVAGRPEPVGYLFKAPRILPWRTARQNLELVLPEGGDEVAILVRDSRVDADEIDRRTAFGPRPPATPSLSTRRSRSH